MEITWLSNEYDFPRFQENNRSDFKSTGIDSVCDKEFKDCVSFFQKI